MSELLIIGDYYTIDCDGLKLDTNLKAKELLNEMCLEHGSSLKGRVEAFQIITHSHQKPCVLISENSYLSYIPTRGIDSDDCVWLNANHLVKCYCDVDKFVVLFDNGYRFVINCSQRTIREQRKRLNDFISYISQRGNYEYQK